jgi:hypothetical protein
MDPHADPDLAILIIDFQDANKKLIEKIFEGTFTSFSKIKSQIEIKVFLTIFA